MATTKTTSKASPSKKAAVGAAKQAPPRISRQAAANGANGAPTAGTTPAPAKRAPAKAAPVKKSAAGTSPARKSPARPATKALTAKAPAKAAPATVKAAKMAPAAVKAAAKEAATKAVPPPVRKPRRTSAASLPVKAGEKAWTPAELRQIKAALHDDIEVLREEIDIAQHEIVDLMRHSGDGAGDDQADAGAKTFEREQEISVANNARQMLQQILHALERLEDGTYGVCEACGNPIGKLRLQAAPRATLCLPCKTKTERR